jgi:adenylate cyclase
MADAAVNLNARTEPTAYDGYRIVVEPSDRRIRVVYRGETVADSTRALVMHETRLPSAYYFPRDDVRMGLMVRTDRRTHCPFKGNASYWTLRVGVHEAENAAWSYEKPYDESSSVKDYIGFIWDAVDAWYADDEEILEQPRHGGDGTVRDNPFIGWLINEAWKAKSSPDLVKRLAEGLVAAGFPLWRLRLFIRTLNPQLFGIIYTWQKNKDEIAEFLTTHEELERERFVKSPLAPIIRGEGGVRRRLDGPGARLDFPILEDLVGEGATDYVAMPLRFSDGQINIVTLVSDRPGGFSTDDLGQLYEILPTLSRLLEAHAQRVSSLTLLTTYLGDSAGERVMNGKVKRGDGEDLHAVIWFSDLRGSTALADSIGREAYLATLNQYFDSVAGAVIEHGGEVLKFIGDAVLAVFAIDDPADPAPEACTRALAAVADARLRIDAVNGERGERGEPPLAFGVGLHRGNLTYGNIGTERRLDFTVIGPAVNEAARIEDLCKTLETPVLMSEALAASLPGGTGLVSLGRHTLRGVRNPQEIFTLPS